MLKIVFRLFVFVLFSCCASSCNKDTDRELECTIEIQNKDLREAITEYQDFLLKDNKKYLRDGDSIYVWVYFKEINDSMARYVLCPFDKYHDFQVAPVLFFSQVNGHAVFFSKADGLISRNFKEPFFEMTEESRNRFIKRFFPKAYKQIQQIGYIYPKRIYEPHLLFLTYKKDSLLDKQFLPGSADDMIYIEHLNTYL